MTVYDVVMIGLVVAGMIWGTIRGFAWQVVSIGSLVVGYFCAHLASAYMLPFLALYLPGDPAFQRGAAMLLAYGVISGGVFAAAWSMRATLKKKKSGAFDRHLGAPLGAIEGALLGVIGTLFVVSLAPKARGPIFSSHAGRVVAGALNAVGPVLPTELRTAMTPFWVGAPTADSPPPSLAHDPAPNTSDDPPADAPPARQASRWTRSENGQAAGDPSKAEVGRSREDDAEKGVKRR